MVSITKYNNLKNIYYDMSYVRKHKPKKESYTRVLIRYIIRHIIIKELKIVTNRKVTYLYGGKQLSKNKHL